VFASRIKGLRTALGKSQQEFAEYLGVSRTAINRWERGHARPDENDLEEIAVKLSVTTAYLRGLVDDKTSSLIEEDLSPLELLFVASRQLRDVSDAIERAVNMLLQPDRGE
jgi:transcriptional regulator with XRE-family HTH domain